MKILEVTPDVQRARSKWTYTGKVRPPFAEPPGPGQESVWDFPRPPRIEPVGLVLSVQSGDAILARTGKGYRVLETAGAPTYYFPPDDVDVTAVEVRPETFHCEWNGFSNATSTRDVPAAGWVMTAVYPEYAGLFGWYAFYPQRLHCFIGDERVTGQPGGYYGGWVTPALSGPIKGGPGSSGW